MSDKATTTAQASASEPARALKVLALGDVMKMTSAGRTHIYKEVGAGRFPRPIRVSRGRVGWLEHEVQAWIAARVAERDAAA